MADVIKWLEGFATADLDEGAADAVTVGMVYQQEAINVIKPAVDALLRALWKTALAPSGGLIAPGTPEFDRDDMIHSARTALREYYGVHTFMHCIHLFKPEDL